MPWNPKSVLNIASWRHFGVEAVIEHQLPAILPGTFGSTQNRPRRWPAVFANHDRCRLGLVWILKVYQIGISPQRLLLGCFMSLLHVLSEVSSELIIRGIVVQGKEVIIYQCVFALLDLQAA